MGYRATLCLLLAALSLLAYTVWVEAVQPTAEEAAARSQALLSTPADELLSLVLTRGEQTLSLQREGERWRVVAPVQDLAAPTEVEGLLVQLDYARVSRRLPGDDPSYGLAQPRATLALSVAGRPARTLALGADAPGGRHAYARWADEADTLLIPKALADLLDRDPVRYREPRALPATGELDKIALTLGDSSVRLSREQGRWLVQAPVQGRADPAWLDLLRRRLDGLRAETFLDAPSTPAPTQEGELVIRAGGESLALRLGPLLPGAPARRLAWRPEGGATFALAEPALRELFSLPEEPRERRLLPYDVRDIEEVTLTQGARALTLRRGPKGWESEPATALDAREVERLLAGLCELPVARFGAPAGPTEEARLSLRLRGGAVDEIALGGEPEPGLRLAARPGDAPLLVPSLALDRFAPDPLRIQDREVARVPVEEVRTLSLQRPGGAVTLSKEGGKWRVVSPLEAPADLRAVEAILEYLRALRAARLLPESTTPEMELSSPRYVLTLTTTGPTGTREITLRVGASRPDGERYASITDREAPFTLDPRAEALFDSRLEELRPFLDLNPEATRAVTVEAGTLSLRAERAPDGWTRTLPRPGTLSDFLVRTYLNDLADTQAEAILPADEAALTLYGLASPSARGSLDLAGQTQRWALGARPDPQGRYALRRDEQGPLYLLSPDEVPYLTRSALPLSF